jgi:hypothetical protein
MWNSHGLLSSGVSVQKLFVDFKSLNYLSPVSSRSNLILDLEAISDIITVVCSPAAKYMRSVYLEQRTFTRWHIYAIMNSALICSRSLSKITKQVHN